MDILRITTAGSVDDGKSTLIGRLLYDTRSVTQDKLEAIEATSRRKGLDFADLSLLTDGLIAEREQGITIDVAHIYFATQNRKYIIADSPGHIEYTRNMITGASNSSLSMILVDARNGVIEQTKRHFYIASLLRIPQVIICVNKMDLVDFSETVFNDIKDDFSAIIKKVGVQGQKITFVPVAAKDGDNVVFSSLNMNWYKGQTLLEYLENTPALRTVDDVSSRFTVQYVIRPHKEAFHDFRGYAGKVASGKFKVGDEITVLPSLKASRIKSILFHDEERMEGNEKESIVITLDDNIDVSRGDMIVRQGECFSQVNTLEAVICWMDESSLVPGKLYFLQHGSNRVKAKVKGVNSILDIQTLESSMDKKIIALNDIGEVSLQLAKPIFADKYDENPANGSFILIDEFTNNTVAVGFLKT
jgi:sulfate adenylyltransferase subunit 1